ncbi:type II toxin-antitoxin system VapC family toxin [Ornithinimicrobium sp. F0845]|uniref:type II toxin-antitoxin system VapC family toxin n=1 Tax=Ornithinimicrobium sp. F0845 TaxID=2926412 RepID=UPI001FF3A98C|nr:type II toxin-antitoxin system VapC family toxin [Ornithinimicrobium sp. F0845]
MNRPTVRSCDTSVLVAALLSWHPQHEVARTAMGGVQILPAHVLLELYSVLTRLPAPHRLAPEAAAEVIDALKLDIRTLPADEHHALLRRLAVAGVRGGATYDALVGATAAHHGLQLLSRDRRARATYDAVGAASILI